MKTVGIKDFTWQIGYGAFSVSSSNVDRVTRYIARQKEHHKVKTFKTEIEEFIKKYNIIEYDERFFWD